jgi:hypothetical protein
LDHSPLHPLEVIKRGNHNLLLNFHSHAPCFCPNKFQANSKSIPSKHPQSNLTQTNSSPSYPNIFFPFFSWLYIFFLFVLYNNPTSPNNFLLFLFVINIYQVSCLLQTIIIPLFLATIFTFSHLLQIAVLFFFTNPFFLVLTNYNLNLGILTQASSLMNSNESLHTTIFPSSKRGYL